MGVISPQDGYGVRGRPKTSDGQPLEFKKVKFQVEAMVPVNMDVPPMAAAMGSELDFLNQITQ